MVRIERRRMRESSSFGSCVLKSVERTPPPAIHAMALAERTGGVRPVMPRVVTIPYNPSVAIAAPAAGQMEKQRDPPVIYKPIEEPKAQVRRHRSPPKIVVINRSKASLRATIMNRTVFVRKID